MKRKYKRRVETLKRFQLVGVIVLLLALGIYFYIISRPEITSFEIEDECGPIGGQISHPIDDEDACSNICRAHCLSKDKGFHESEFELRDPDCNYCNCYCEE